MIRVEAAQNREIFGYILIDQDNNTVGWESLNTPLSRFFENGRPGKLPRTFEFLRAEGWLADILNGKEDCNLTYLKNGVRFLSNITLSLDTKALEDIELDKVYYPLSKTTDGNGVYQGVYSGPRGESFAAIENEIADFWKKNSLTPKFSGAQAKIAVSHYDIGDRGEIVPAVSTHFSHILKPAGDGELQSVSFMEWIGLQLAKQAGVAVADSALVDMPDGMAPAVIVERFDIENKGQETDRYIRLADFCNMTGQDPKYFKYNSDIEICFRKLAEVSDSPQEDVEALFKRVAFSFYLCDNDMHLKNLSVIRLGDPETGEVKTRLAPAYDVLPTQVFPSIETDKNFALGYREDPENNMDMIKPINRISDLIKVATRVGIDKGHAEMMAKEIGSAVVHGMYHYLENPPECAKSNARCMESLKHGMTVIFDKAYDNLVDDLPDFDWGHDSYEHPPRAEIDENADLTPAARTVLEFANRPNLAP